MEAKKEASGGRKDCNASNISANLSNLSIMMIFLGFLVFPVDLILNRNMTDAVYQQLAGGKFKSSSGLVSLIRRCFKDSTLN